MKISALVIISLICYCLYCHSLAAQEKIDSLEKAVEYASKTDKARLYNLLSEEYANISAVKAAEYGLKALETARISNNDLILAQSHYTYGLSMYYSGRYRKSIAHFDSSLMFYQKIGSQKNIIITKVRLSNAYVNQNKYQLALKIQFDALRLAEDNQNIYGQIYTCNQIGNLYINTKDYKNAAEFLKKARKLAETYDYQNLLSNNYAITGNMYMEEGKYIESLHFLRQALYLFSFHEDKTGQANIYVLLGDYYIYTDNPKTALENYRKALQIALEINLNRIKGTIFTKISHTFEATDKLEQALDYNFKALEARMEYGNMAYTGSSYINIGTTFFSMKEYDSAYKYYLKGLDIVGSVNNKKYIANSYYQLYRLFEEKEELLDALNYYIKYSETNDSILFERKSKELTEIQSKYELQQSMNEIQIHKLMLEKQRQQSIILIIAIALIVLVFILFYYRYNTSKKLSGKYKLLNQQLQDQYQRRSEELREKEAQFTNLVEQIPMGVYRTTPDGKIIFANNEIAKLLGYQNVDEVYKIKLEDDHKMRRIDREKYKSELRQKGEIKAWESVWTRKDGASIYVSEYARLVRDSDGKEAYYEGVVEDITKRKKAEQELKNALEKAEESDRLKTAFLSTMQHELRTPLNGILGFSELLSQEENFSEEEKDYINMIHESGKNLLGIINDILDASLITAGKVRLAKQNIRLDEVFEEIYQDYQQKIRESKDKRQLQLMLSKEIKDEEAQMVSDPIRLRQIMSNLIDNAIKFTYKGTIEFGYTRQPNGEILFFVKDTGIGIPPEKQSIIFDIFRQGEDTDTREFGGSGLGLSISKTLVEVMGGRIWVNSTEGEGSNFQFTLPHVLPDKPVASMIRSKRAKERNWKDKTILITEDNFSNFLLLKTFLKKTGATLIHAKNGEEALRFVKKHPEIDLVLMDIQLPGISGYHTTEKIKDLRENLKIVAVTAYATEMDKESCVEAGCDDHIPKPINKKMFFDVLDRYL